MQIFVKKLWYFKKKQYLCGSIAFNALNYLNIGLC